MKWNVLWAIFKRNFVSYFSNPTGYVFICVFVLLSSLAAFWPNEFFNNNLANLDQLNKYLPFIMLVFIPAITMTIWADERRQGTDELLLTIPANDVEVVLGKYLAAVAIFSASLLFSMVANLWVLLRLGTPDMGLFLGTHVGYWFVGLAMLAVGMVASFLTGNLTVAFILGALFNAVLALSSSADVIVKDPTWAQAVERWSLAEQFRDFQRGVLSLSSISYFVMIAAVMLYLCVVLIGRRHWLGGRDGRSMLGHYLIRTASLVALAVGINYFFSNQDRRLDVTSERLSSLSPQTLTLIRELGTDKPVQIEAYVSPTVPSEYVPTRLNLLSTLEELKSLGTGKIQVTTHILENFSQEAAIAEQKYDIKPQTVLSRQRGARTQEDIFLAAAFTCGLDKVVIPFVDKGIPVEYELVRSICTVAQEKRKRLGVVRTDVPLFSSFNMQMMTPSEDSKLIAELRKQYEVVEVDPSNPITDRFDVLLAVQPSSLGPDQMGHFVDAVRRGQPTAIFEDPFPLPNFYPNVPGTAQPKQPPQSMPFMMGRQPPQPKGDIEALWELLGVRLAGNEVIWQAYNPYPKGQDFITPEWVFIDRGAGQESPFDTQHPITRRLQQVLFMFPGAWQQRNTTDMQFKELAATVQQPTGTIRYDDIMQLSRSPVGMSLRNFEIHTGDRYVLAAHIRGKPQPQNGLASVADDAAKQDDQAEETPAVKTEGSSGAETAANGADQADASAQPQKPADTEPEINVVLVSDIDCLASAFFFVREAGEEEAADINWDFDNVAFVLNTLDVLGGDERFVEVRTRRRPHRTLEKVEARTELAREEATRERQKFVDAFQKAKDEEQKKFDDRIKEIEDRKDLDPRTKRVYVETARIDGQRRLDTRVAAHEQQRNQELRTIERDLSLEVRRVQDWYKLLAVLIPPIPPLLLGFFVFFHRRQMEREGVSKSRLR